MEVMNVKAELRNGLEEYPCPLHEGHDNFGEKVRSDEEGDEEPAFSVQVGDERKDGEDGELGFE